jgi:hypothetical protein
VHRQRLLTRWTTAVATSLLLLAVAQVVALSRTAPTLREAVLTVPKEAFGLSADRRDVTVTFQLRNDGDRALRVAAVGESLPGLELLDVVATGSPLEFRESGRGTDELEAFALEPEAVALLALTFRLSGCGQVPAGAQPVPVDLRAGRARGTVRVALPRLPSDAATAGPDDLVEWQTALVRELCG